MKRTTLALQEPLLRQLKLQAAERGCSLQQIVNDLLGQALNSPLRRSFRLELEGWDGIQNANLDLFDRNALFEALEEGRR